MAKMPIYNTEHLFYNLIYQRGYVNRITPLQVSKTEDSAMSKVIDKVDVICQHKADGEIIPLRFRLMNEDGMYETYTIKGYRQIFRKDVYTTPDGLTVCSSDNVYECRVVILEMYRTVRLYFNKLNCHWRIAI